MRYELAFKYYVSRPGGWNNLFMVAICALIPVIGNIVLLGYFAEVAVRLIRDPDMEDYPNFSFDHFMEYLKRGVWPFLVQVIVSTAISIVVAICGGIPLGISAALDVIVIGVLIFVAVELVAVIATLMIVWPATLHAQLTNKLDFEGLRTFIPAFWRLLGAKAIVSLIVFWFIAIATILIGLVCCVIGVIPASALVQTAAQHLMVQHYRMYLDADGTPIPIYDSLPDTSNPKHDLLNLD